MRNPEPFGELVQVVMGVGILNVSHQLPAAALEIHAPSQQVAGGAHVSRIGIGQREVAALEQCGDLEGVDLVVFGFAAMDGLHVQRVTQDEGDAVLGAQIGDPVPAKDALDTDDDVVQEGGDQLKKQLGLGMDILMQPGFALLVDDADVHFSSVQIDTAVELVLLFVEPHGVASFG
jgi:hypothetical protein